jgi:hypothetical protein
LGEIPITSEQAAKLELSKSTQLSPCLEACCLRVSANVSYQRAAEDIKYITGIEVSKSVQQRLVHRQEFNLPQKQSKVKELSVDGGNIRLRTPLGQSCEWKGYKAVCLHNQEAVAASFQDNNLLQQWVKNQPTTKVITCLGDGHDGIWNLVKEFKPDSQRRNTARLSANPPLRLQGSGEQGAGEKAENPSPCSGLPAPLLASKKIQNH